MIFEIERYYRFRTLEAGAETSWTSKVVAIDGSLLKLQDVTRTEQILNTHAYTFISATASDHDGTLTLDVDLLAAPKRPLDARIEPQREAWHVEPAASARLPAATGASATVNDGDAREREADKLGNKAISETLLPAPVERDNKGKALRGG